MSLMHYIFGSLANSQVIPQSERSRMPISSPWRNLFEPNYWSINCMYLSSSSFSRPYLLMKDLLMLLPQHFKQHRQANMHLSPPDPLLAQVFISSGLLITRASRAFIRPNVIYSSNLISSSVRGFPQRIGERFLIMIKLSLIYLSLSMSTGTFLYLEPFFGPFFISN